MSNDTHSEASNFQDTAETGPLHAAYNLSVAEGLRQLVMVEYTSTATGTEFFGDAGVSDDALHPGMMGTIWR